MKVFYDKEVDALYIQLNELTPEGAIEVKEGINIDVSNDGKIYGIEILEASRKLDLKTILTYTLDEELIESIA